MLSASEALKADALFEEVDLVLEAVVVPELEPEVEADPELEPEPDPELDPPELVLFDPAFPPSTAVPGRLTVALAASFW